MANATSFPGGVSVSPKGSVKTIVDKCEVIRIKFSDGTSENVTGFSLPANAIVTGVYLFIRTEETTGTTKEIDVGINGGDTDGYLDGISVAAPGLTQGSLDNAGVTKGALLRADITGTSTFAHEDDVASGGGEVSWTPGSADFAEFDADLIIKYAEVL